MKRFVIATALVVGGGVGTAVAQGMGWFDDPFARVFLMRQSVPTGYTCIKVDPGFHYMGTQARKDVISTFARFRADGTVETVCYLTPPNLYMWSRD